MAGNPQERYSREGTPLGRTAEEITFTHGYGTGTARSRKLWWRVRDLLRRPVRNSGRRH